MMIKRSELWRKEYRARRYLQHVDSEELAQRLRDIMDNSMVLYESGKIGPRRLEKSGGCWIEKFTHVYEEYQMRGMYFPDNVLKNAHLPKPTYPNPPKSATAVEGRKIEDGKYLIKYGKRLYLEKMFNDGLVRILPASKYRDPSLNPAMRDDELSITTFALPSEVKITNAAGQSINSLASITKIAFTRTCNTDYYVYCLSYVYDHRLFNDFEADCCIIINKPKEFSDILNGEFTKEYPGWKSLNASVDYIDPFLSKSKTPATFFSKHFRYSYQYEHRFVYLPPSNVAIDSLEEKYLNLGCLKNMAELVILG